VPVPEANHPNDGDPVREFTLWIREHVVRSLNEHGVPVDLHTVQWVLVLAPVIIVVAAFARASWKKKQRMRDAGM